MLIFIKKTKLFLFTIFFLKCFCSTNRPNTVVTLRQTTIFFTLFDVANTSQIGFQDPATFVMHHLIDLHHDIMFFLILISIFVSFILCEILLSFGFYTNKELLPSNVYHHTLLEVVWTLVPTAILLCIAVPSFNLLYIIDYQLLYASPSATIKVIGHQWYWGYEYNELPEVEVRMQSEADLFADVSGTSCFRLLETDNYLVLPTNEPLRFLVTSTDVIHSWAVPSLGIKIDATPGRLNQVLTIIDRPGIFYGQCSEICGVNHGFMPIAVCATDNAASFILQ